LTKPGKTYTYFCRIHPFMRGSIRVKGKKAPKKSGAAAIVAGASGALPGSG
jgi:hypothetical protein